MPSNWFSKGFQTGANTHAPNHRKPKARNLCRSREPFKKMHNVCDSTYGVESSFQKKFMSYYMNSFRIEVPTQKLQQEMC